MKHSPIFLVLLAALPCAAAFAQAPPQRRGAAAPAAPATPAISDRQACAILKTTLPLADDSGYNALRLVQRGIMMDLPKNRQLAIVYDDITNIERVPANRPKENATLTIFTTDKRVRYGFSFDSAHGDRNANAAQLQTALQTLALDAHRGKAYTCSDDPADYANALAGFAIETAAWRALPAKPAVSDDVYRDRLLAEDALTNKNLPAAIKYYEDGIAAGPTWDQGWFNLALVYAENQDYFDAAECMKHYVTLMPDAPDARKAKDNIILWEAKAAVRPVESQDVQKVKHPRYLPAPNFL